MEFIQAVLTYTIEAIAFITIIGLPAYYIVTKQPEAEAASEVVPIVEAVEEAVSIASYEEILKSGVDRGYRQIMQFSTIRYNLHDSVLIIDCPTFDDTDVLLNEYGEQLCLKVKQLKLFSFIEMKVAGETLYSYPLSLVLDERWQ